jgi:phosphonate transport system permease protein
MENRIMVENELNAFDPLKAPSMRRPYMIVVGLGAILVIIAYFLPWISKNGLFVSGFRFTLSGYPFLIIIPILGMLSLFLMFKNPYYRPLAFQIVSVFGLLSILLLFSMVMNYDDGNLAFYRGHDASSHIRFRFNGEVIQLDSYADIAIGFYLMIAGFATIYFSPLLRLYEVRTQNSIQEGDRCRPQPVGSLEDLRPRWILTKEFKISAMILVCSGVLLFTYTWCGISPMQLWENRGNAKEYLFGRDLNPADEDYIQDQRERAPEIEAQGRARAYQDNKYRGIPFAEQPGLEEKFKENEALAQKFLSEMSETEKENLKEKAYQNALIEKRGGYFPPETASEKLKGYLLALLETIAIAIWGTLLAIGCAVPASLLAARNTLQLIVTGDNRWAKGIRWFCIFGVRRFLDSCRGFNEFVMALIFVAVIGLGPYAGILALWIHTFGILGKVFSEQIEAIDNGQLEALNSTGAFADQTIAFSVLPQVMPGFVSYSLLRFESNVRSATILGFVGAGGIGFLMFDKINGYLFREVCTMMLIIITSVSVIDYLCAKLRRKFI